MDDEEAMMAWARRRLEDKDGGAVEDGDEDEDEFATCDPSFHVNPFSLASADDVLDYESYFFLDNWYEDVREHTIPSVCILFKMEELNALQDAFRDASSSSTGEVEQFPLEIPSSLQSLTQRVSDAMDLLGGSYFFVRTSSRSPKDVGLRRKHPHMRAMCEGELAQERARVPSAAGSGTLSANEKLRALQRAARRCGRVRCAEEALSLVMLSERIYQDVCRIVHHNGAHHEDATKPPVAYSMCVRQWNAEIEVHREFRCFICDYDLAAISSYDDMCHYSALDGLSKRCARVITRAWENTLRECVPYASCVVDVALLGPEYDKVLLIEINPFGPLSGSALFDWEVERSLLQGRVDCWSDLEEWERTHAPHTSSPHVMEWPCIIEYKHKEGYGGGDGFSSGEDSEDDGGPPAVTIRMLSAPREEVTHLYVRLLAQDTDLFE